jgi:TonB family protein
LNAHKNMQQHLLHFLSRRNLIAALVALTLSPMPSAWADRSLEEQIKFDYLDKVLTLRHFYSGDHLRFRSDGTLQGDAPVGLWTMDGQIEVEDVHLHGARLEIKARRMHRTFDAQSNLQDQLSTVENGRDKWQKDLEKSLRRLKVEIEIELPNDTPGQKDIEAAINAVFLSKSEFMSDIVPSYWHDYLAKREGTPRTPPEPKKDTVYTIKPGGRVTAPRVHYNPDPEYSDEARKAKFQGTIVVSLIVDSSGAPKDLQIVKPLGLGLDEKAIAAVSAWTFEPAKKDGQPVAVAIAVEVDFRLY